MTVATPLPILRSLADALAQAERDAAPIAPITATHPELTPRDAYAIQALNVERRCAADGHVIGRKVGLTSRAMQEMLGVNEPDYGVMFDDTRLASGEEVELDALIAPRVEPEIAFVLGRDLAGPGVTAADVLAATDHVIPALEVIDSRIADWRIGLVDTIADNASYGRIVLGSRPTRADSIDLASATVELAVDGGVTQRGDGAAVLGHPAEAVAWLANALHEFGVTLAAGEVVLPGSMTAAIPLAAGKRVAADFGSLGSVEMTAR